jgi:hypothetical protein
MIITFMLSCKKKVSYSDGQTNINKTNNHINSLNTEKEHDIWVIIKIHLISLAFYINIDHVTGENTRDNRGDKTDA